MDFHDPRTTKKRSRGANRVELIGFTINRYFLHSCAIYAVIISYFVRISIITLVAQNYVRTSRTHKRVPYASLKPQFDTICNYRSLRSPMPSRLVMLFLRPIVRDPHKIYNFIDPAFRAVIWYCGWDDRKKSVKLCKCINNGLYGNACVGVTISEINSVGYWTL